MLPNKGKTLHRGSRGADKEKEFRLAIAAALKSELGTTHPAVKTVMGWTGASERAVKHWFAGTHGPSAYHLVAIAHHSDAVLTCFLLAAERPHHSIATRLNRIRHLLVELLAAIDAHPASMHDTPK